jgi:hypothetical protein
MIQSTWWPRVQPERDRWAFQSEQVIDHCAQNGMHVLGVFFRTPDWAAQSRAHPPRDIAEYERYVRRTVEHYRDRIRHWEVWNEPQHSGSWLGTAQEYVELARVTWRAAKAADPDCVIVGGGGLSHQTPDFSRQVMAAGLLQYCDWLSYHTYIPVEAPPENALEPVRFFRDLLTEYGHPDMPLICSEGGLTDTTWLEGLDLPELPPERVRPPMTWRAGAHRLVQISALEMAAGVRKHFYYYMNSPPPARAYYDYSALEVTGAPRPKLMAWMAMERILRGCRHVDTAERGTMHAEVFEGPDRAVAIIWADDGTELALETPPVEADARDLMGNEFEPALPLVVTEKPQYIISTDATGEELANGLRN